MKIEEKSKKRREKKDGNENKLFIFLKKSISICN